MTLHAAGVRLAAQLLQRPGCAAHAASIGRREDFHQGLNATEALHGLASINIIHILSLNMPRNSLLARPARPFLQENVPFLIFSLFVKKHVALIAVYYQASTLACHGLPFSSTTNANHGNSSTMTATIRGVAAELELQSAAQNCCISMAGLLWAPCSSHSDSPNCWDTASATAVTSCSMLMPLFVYPSLSRPRVPRPRVASSARRAPQESGAAWGWQRATEC